MAAACCLVLLFGSGHGAWAQELRKNIVVLVDVSKSVDPANRESALKLVAGLATGKMDDASRRSWEFKPAPGAAYPAATSNLQRLIQPAAEPSQPLARDPARFVINPLGNYQRVGELREQLAKPKDGGPDEIAKHLLGPVPPFGSTDNSTHISLAEAVVAQAFLKPSSQLPYYLIVISDFYEDCLNHPVSDYTGKSAQVKAANDKVLRGELAFNDGAGIANHKYSAADVEGIRFLNEKISDLMLGEFIYRGVPMPATPVNVKIYSPMVKSGLKFADSSAMKWVLPDPAPGIAVVAEGLDMNAPLDVRIVNLATHTEKTLKETCGLILARNRLEVAALLDRPELKQFIAPGNYQISLGVTQASGLGVDVKCSLQVLAPKISIGGDELNNSTDGQPFVFPANKVLTAEKVMIKLDPAPGKSHDVAIQCGKKRATVGTINGSGELTLADLLDGAAGDEPIKLAATLKLDPTPESATKEVWLRLPEVSLWAVYAGELIDGGNITLSKTRALALKASHVGMEGLEWRGTSVINNADKQKAPLALEDYNNLDFSEVRPGTYTVTAKFGSSDHPKEKTFTVIVPPKTPWMLITFIAMAILSLGLFGWHFLRR